MIKKIPFYALTISTLLIAPQLANAKDSYVTMQAGAAIPHSKFTHETVGVPVQKKLPKTGWEVNAGVGTEVFQNTYAELSVGYARHKLKNNYLDQAQITNNGVIATFANDKSSLNSKLESLSGLVSLNYRFKNLSSSIIPYVTAGVGISSNKTKTATLTQEGNHSVVAKSKTTTNAAWQVGAGFLVPLNKSMSVNVNYKYKDLGKYKTVNRVVANPGNVVEDYKNPFVYGKLRSSNISLGLDINF